MLRRPGPISRRLPADGRAADAYPRLLEAVGGESDGIGPDRRLDLRLLSGSGFELLEVAWREPRPAFVVLSSFLSE